MTRLQSPPSDISDQARNFQEWVNNVDAFLETCDGGDHGSPDAPSIWLLGLEPGWSLDDRRREALGDGRCEELDYSVKRQLKWPFNRNAFKLLAALQGTSLEKYKDFAQDKRPFEKGCTGYFKGNLFPVACSKMSAWDEGHRQETGFETKDTYQDWVCKARFPIVRSWIEKCRPRLVICSGLTRLYDFTDATGTVHVPEAHRFDVNGHEKRMHVATKGTVPIAVIPHLSGGPAGLNSNKAIVLAAKHIRDVLGWGDS